MNDESPVRTSTGPTDQVRLAYERTFLAHERTQMAWARTALTLITFGFTIAKFFEYLRREQPERRPLLGAHAVGLLMIAVGLVALALAGLQHLRALRSMRRECPGLPISIAGIVVLLLSLLGILAFCAAILRG